MRGSFSQQYPGRIATTPNRNLSSKFARTGSITRLASLAQTRSYPRVFLWLQCTERRGSESRGNPVRCWSRAFIRLTLGGQVGVGQPRCRRSKLPVEWSAGESLGIRGALHFSLAVLTVFTC